MFIGEFYHTIDEKGRLAVPVKFRTALEAGAVVTRGLDASLFLYTLEEWDKLAVKLAALPLGQADARAFARLMLAGAMAVELDRQGRLVIPEYLRAYAKVERQVVVTGLYNRIELWAKETWEAYKRTTEQDADRIAEHLGALGI